ncbi:glycosyltransferase [Halomicroarcula sp. F13]|uniref:Glycosyltransferase n=1 Tax=Haloarcula rubra TaxID=2487747 RepID=A0AAW4PLS2_9EURY|nr:glycosyltransferase [Halomicroarcula rubra]MBX0322022.1 glycosyltransferase [Halomicroarcula rubra]
MHNARTESQSIAAYDPYVREQQRDAIHEAASELGDVRVAHVNTTASGGGVAEILHSLVPLLNDVGVDTDWLVMDAPDEFYDVTKAIHNGLQGDRSEFTESMRETYRTVTVENAQALTDRYDVVVLHDPQSLGMAPTLAETFPETVLVWRCHIDLTDATPAYLEFVQSYLDPIDRAIFTLPEYGDAISGVEKVAVHPAIDPLTEKNRPLDELSGAAAEAADPESFPFDTDRPLMLQISRFDPWKDPLGVIDAYHDVTESVPDTQLALVGSMPDDDPEGIEVYRKVEAAAADSPDVHLLTNLPDAGINALQRYADVVLQKSLREGFALTVSEALWKGTPVVGGDVGGIPLQIDDGVNGYLVEPMDIAGTADRVTGLLEDDQLRASLGDRGRETVRERFLTPRLVEDYLTLLATVTEGGRAG